MLRRPGHCCRLGFTKRLPLIGLGSRVRGAGPAAVTGLLARVGVGVAAERRGVILLLSMVTAPATTPSSTRAQVILAARRPSTNGLLMVSHRFRLVLRIRYSLCAGRGLAMAIQGLKPKLRTPHPTALRCKARNAAGRPRGGA